MAKRKVIVLPVNENNTILNVNYAVHIDLKLDIAFNFVLLSTRGVRSNLRLDPIFRIICFQTHSIIFAVRRFLFEIMRFWFLHHQVSSPSAGYLFFEEMAKRKVIVFPVNENNTFLKVLYAVHIDLKLDIAFNLVLLSTRGVRSNFRLDPVV